jgi:hypothetical protein
MTQDHLFAQERRNPHSFYSHLENASEKLPAEVMGSFCYPEDQISSIDYLSYTNGGIPLFFFD